MDSKRIRNGMIYFLLVVALGAFLYIVLSNQGSNISATVSIAEIASLVRGGNVQEIHVDGDEVLAYSGGKLIGSRKETGIGLIETLENLGVTEDQLSSVNVQIEAPSGWEVYGSILLALLPILLIAVFFIFILRQAQGAGNQAFSFSKSKARMFTGDKPTVNFGDVAGNEEARQDLAEVVEFLKEPQKFASLGARIPKGVLLVGPPGTGKTLMAKAVSGEAGVPFFNISGSEFVEMFVGVGASRVRDLFEQAKKNSPCIIFIDEIDAVGRHRGAGLGGSHDEREQTLNQILVEMDGFDTDVNIIIIAATNRPDILDPALLRPGRFDRQVIMDSPDVKGRQQILDVHVKGKPLATDIDLEVVARQTPGFVGADIENLVNEAAILAARRNRRSIGLAEFQEAVERVRIGPERRSRIMSPKEKEVIAYHEAGHAVAMHVLPNHDPLLKVTIVPRGVAAGYAMSIPEEESKRDTKDMLRDTLAAALGGRVAEEIKFGDITNGAVGDLKIVTDTARKMITQWGMSERLGPIQYGEREEMVFLGRGIAETRNYSDKVAQEIDEEVRKLVDEAHRRCREILTSYEERLDAVAAALVDQETLNDLEFSAIMRGEDPFNSVEGAEESHASGTPSSERDGSERPQEEDSRDQGLDLSGGTLPAPA